MRKFLLSLATLSIAVTVQSQSWTLTGNAGTNPSIHFLGTTDNNPIRFRVNNSIAGEINPNGSVSFGVSAGAASSGTNSVAIGYRSSNFSLAYQNTSVGAYTLESNYGSQNCVFGYGAMQLNQTGGSNTAMGYAVLVQNRTGYDNSGFGRDALRSNYNGYYNTGVGSMALFRQTGSQYNTAIGYRAGDSYDLGWNNTILGANCDGAFAGQYNIVAIGQGTICPDNSTARIGNSATWSIGGYAPWTNFSDGRFKKDIQENVPGLEFIMKLRPVTYHLDIAGVSRQSKENHGQEWDDRMKEAIAEKEKVLYTGFVAQEVEQAAKDAGYDFSGVDKPRNENAFYGLRYSDFVVPAVKAIQDQQLMIEELKKQNAELVKRITDLERKAGITFSGNATDALTVWPNPSADKILVNIFSDERSQALIKIYDSKGALVQQQSANLAQGLNQAGMSIKNLPKGAYHISVEWGHGKQKKTAKVVKE